MSESFRIPVITTRRNAARFARIAKKRFGAVRRGAVNTLGLEALVVFADNEEKKLELPPITEEQVNELVPLKAGRKSAV